MEKRVKSCNWPSDCSNSDQVILSRASSGSQGSIPGYALFPVNGANDVQHPTPKLRRSVGSLDAHTIEHRTNACCNILLHTRDELIFQGRIEVK